jgi:hypothetical protein
LGKIPARTADPLDPVFPSVRRTRPHLLGEIAPGNSHCAPTCAVAWARRSSSCAVRLSG